MSNLIFREKSSELTRLVGSALLMSNEKNRQVCLMSRRRK